MSLNFKGHSVSHHVRVCPQSCCIVSRSCTRRSKSMWNYAALFQDGCTRIFKGRHILLITACHHCKASERNTYEAQEQRLWLRNILRERGKQQKKWGLSSSRFLFFSTAKTWPLPAPVSTKTGCILNPFCAAMFPFIMFQALCQSQKDIFDSMLPPVDIHGKCRAYKHLQSSP